MPPLHVPPDARRLARYFAGEADPADTRGIDEWIAHWGATGDPRAAEVEALRAIWTASAGRHGRVDVERALARLTRDTGTRRDAAERQLRNTGWRSRGAARGRWAVWAGAAGAMAIIIGVSQSVGRVIGARSARQPFREFASAPGGRATITLRDGTHLVLGPATTLRVPANYGRGERAVELDGQALFSVVHDGAHPFAVRTARAVIRDVGTTFTVYAYAADKQERIAVRDGIVSIGGRPLQAHDVAVIDSMGRLTLRVGVNVEPYLSWVQGGLVFEDTPLQDVVKDLARAFDLDIAVTDPTLLAHHITSSFGAESADDVLDAVSIAVGASYTRSGRHVVLRRRIGAADRRIPVMPAPAVLTDRRITTTP